MPRLLIFEGETLHQRRARCADAAGSRRACVDAGLQPGERVVRLHGELPRGRHRLQRASGGPAASTTPVLFLLSDDELRHVLADSEAAYVVTTPDFLPKVQAAGAGTATLRGVDPRRRRGAGHVVLSPSSSPAAEGSLVDATRPTGRAALHRRHDRALEGRDAQPQRDVRRRVGSGHAVATTRSMTVALLPLPLSHAYGLLVSTLACMRPTRQRLPS